MSDTHVRYSVSVHRESDTVSAVRVIQQDDYHWEDAVDEALSQMVKDRVLPSCDDLHAVTITVERVR